jgi:hypothetical protein
LIVSGSEKNPDLKYVWWVYDLVCTGTYDGDNNMNLSTIAQSLNLTYLTPEISLDSFPEVTGGYASDLLSDVLAHAPRGGVLVTVQVHLNVIAVALHAELAAVVFASGRFPEEDVKTKAMEERIALFSSEESAFEVVGKLYALGLRGAPT